MVSQKSPPNRQPTISSFFSQKPAGSSQVKSKHSPPKPKAPSTTTKKTTAEHEKENTAQSHLESTNEVSDNAGPARNPISRKRTLEEDMENDSDGDDLYSNPNHKTPAKIPRLSSGTDNKEEHNVLPTRTRPLKTQSVRATQPGTASRYRYNPTQTDPMEVGAEENPERSSQKQKLHEKFVKKLANTDIFDRRRRDEEGGENELDADEDGTLVAEEEEEEVGPIAKRFGKGKAATKSTSKKAKSKLTPLEQQVVDIKRQYPDTVLIVEVGYKFRFFGEDARTASQNLSIMCIPGKMRFDNHPSEAHYDRFASASIPVHRLHVHVKRLVAAGYKVGVVRQLETAALKAAGDNKSAPFERKLTSLYTKGTYIDDIDAEGGDLSSGAGSGGAPNTGFLLCITEKPSGGSGTDEKTHVGIIAVQPTTGDIIYDEFHDGFMRSEIETRLLHIAPCEFLIVGELTKATEKLVSHLSGSITALGDKVRVERIEKAKNSEAEASNHVSRFYAGKIHSAQVPDEKNKLLDSVMNLPSLVTLCLSSMITHMSAYGLEHVFDLTKYFQPFSARSHMLLNGNTLSSLEIYRNQTDYTSKGSLFWTLDRTKTKFGKRLLRNWVGRPLLDRTLLGERIKAVEEIKDSNNPRLERLRELVSKITYDLEKGLIKIYYGKCTRPELLSVLQTMLRISETFQNVDSPEKAGFDSNMINNAIAALPRIKDDIKMYLNVFNHQAAGKDDKYDFFKESNKYDSIENHKMSIVAVEADLNEHLKEVAVQLKKNKVSYVTVSGVEYMIEVGNDKASLKNVPASWIKMSGTKKVSRFHTPTVTALMRERDQHKESLAAECDRAFKSFLAEISTKYQEFRDCIQALATLDCLLSLAAVASMPNYVKPEFSADTSVIVEEGRHPMVEQLLLDTYVPNNIDLNSAGRRAMLVTGPNMGGKSSYVRQVALICIMAQIGSYVPAKSAKLGLLDAVFTRMGAFDNMLTGESTFMVELSETSDILKQATPRSLIILDELGRGTSTHDGVAIAHAVLDHVVNDLKSLLLFVTHYPLLARFGEKYPEAVMNAHMRFEESKDGSDEITFLYEVGEGVAHRSYGLNVARLAGLPKSCLEVASVQSRHLEEVLKQREALRWAKGVQKITSSENSEDVDVEALLTSLEYLDV